MRRIHGYITPKKSQLNILNDTHTIEAELLVYVCTLCLTRKRPKAYAGSCLPAHYVNTKIHYETYAPKTYGFAGICSVLIAERVISIRSAPTGL